MDTNTLIIAATIVFAVVAIVAFIRYRRQGSADFKGPFGLRLRVKGEDTTDVQKPGIRAKDITSHEGGLLAEETTGAGIDLERVDVKTDVKLSSGRQEQSIEKRLESRQPNLLNAQALSAGRDITIQQFVGDTLPIAQQLAFFSQQLGLEKRLSKYAASQFEAYSNIWKKLQALRLAGDKLWEEASDDNLYEFGNQLRQVKKLALEEDIYLEDMHRAKLDDVIYDFGRFFFGKILLIDIRSKEELARFMKDADHQEEIRERIQFNRNAKVQYERLLEEIRIAFKDKLSKL